nr:MAG TPA: hypothetical protein [Bacteriophage sp.]
MIGSDKKVDCPCELGLLGITQSETLATFYFEGPLTLPAYRITCICRR